MPLHELYNNKAKQKLDPSNDHSSAPKDDLFELVWENGQISMQGQSSKARKIPTCKSLPSQCLPSYSPRSHDKEVVYTNTKMGGKFGDLDAQLNEMNLSQDEEVMIPWLNYGMDVSFQHDYSSNFLHELSGVTMNELVTSNNNFTLLDRRSKQGTPPSTSQLYQPLSSIHQCQTSFGYNRSRELDVAENNTNNDATQHAPCGEITQIPPSSNGFSTLKMERHGQVMSSNSSTSTIMNFSHFAKPVAIVKANLQNIALTPSRSESVGIKNKGEAANRSNLPESTKVDLSGEECPKKQAVQSEQVVEPSKVDLKTLEPKSCEQDAADCNKFDPACQEDASKIDQTSNIVVGESGRKRQEAAEKSKEPAVVASSVCSDNGAERGFNDLNQNLKRKSRDTEESDCHSEDVEEESVGVKKAAPARGMGSKRSRSAEVHNLSERRRRDRINERMRALQELIPNCNKADKASMLDEAIEYLKTLQLQLQIMSMGAGLYMPTMMLPMGMQTLHTPHMAPFSPMSVGMQMGLGMGYGMGMPDVQVPQMQGPHLPVPDTSGSGPNALHGMARPNPQVFGLPGQGLPLQMPRAPMFSFPAENLMNPSAPGINASGTAGVMENVDLASAPLPNVNSQVMQSNNGCNSANQMLSTQCEARTGGFEHSTMALNSGHVSLTNGRGVVHPVKGDNLVINKSSKQVSVDTCLTNTLSSFEYNQKLKFCGLKYKANLNEFHSYDETILKYALCNEPLDYQNGKRITLH